MTSARKPSKGGQETKDKILDAALETLGTEGLVGTSARAIAKTGDFNQALVFYHFGSIAGLLLAALDRAHEHRMATFGPDIAKVNDLAGLASIGQKLHAASCDSDQAALAAIVAGWPSTSEHGKTVLAVLKPWNDLIAEALTRIVGDHPLAQFMPADDLAYAVSALFFGIELLDRLDPTRNQAGRLYTVLSNLSALSGPMLDSLRHELDKPS